jgi:predicted DNA-binding transcriptional regulator YafY
MWKRWKWRFTRLMELLAILQSAPERTGEQLSVRLGVTLRTVRRDINRLRDAGYLIEATPGVYGGYRLVAGTRLPPVVLTDDEAVAVAVALRGTTSATVAGLGDDATHGALAKLEHLLPAPLRARVADLREATVSMLRTPAVPSDAERLALLAHACNNCMQTRITYSARPDKTTTRTLEPYRLVQTSHCWYLVALTTPSREWRTYRVDRIREAQLTGATFERTNPPDPKRIVTEGTAVAPYSQRTRLRLPVSAEEALDHVPRSYGLVEPIDAHSSELTVGYEHLRWLVHFIADLPWTVEVIEPGSLRDSLADVGKRLLATTTRRT